MPKGFVTLTHSQSSQRKHRFAVTNIADYVRSYDDGFTHITCHSVADGNSESVNVLETPDEIDALIEQAQGETPKSETPKSEFAQAMGGAMAASFGGAR